MEGDVNHRNRNYGGRDRSEMLTAAHIVAKETWGKRMEMQMATNRDVELSSPASYRYF